MPCSRAQEQVNEADLSTRFYLKSKIMARQKGIIKLKGKLGDLSFYRTKDGYLAREKGGIDGDRIKNDPAFIRTRENGQEFGNAATSGKLLRDAIRVMMQNASDNRVTARLTRLMTVIKNMDTMSTRGNRTVGSGIADPAALALLKGFNFNNRAILGSILYKPYTVDVSTGEIEMVDFAPINDINAPAGATHVSLTGAWAKVDFSLGVSSIEVSPTMNFALDATMSTVNLVPAVAPTSSGNDFFLLLVEFYQEVNGQQYSLKNGAFNALNIVEAQ